MDISIKEPSPEIATEIQSIAERAKSYAVISTEDDLLAAGEFQKSVKIAQKRADEFFDADIKRAHELHKSLVTQKKKVVKPLDDALAILSPAIGKFMFQKQQEAQKSAAVAPGITKAEPAKPEGISASSTWKCVVVDFSALAKAVFAKKAPLLAIQPNEKFLDEQARSLKEHFDFPGCKAEQIFGTRTRI